MPIPYYNTSLPTPSTKNSINSIAVTYGIRDFLLNKNLLPVYPQISTSLNGSPKIGEPVLDTMIGTGNVLQPFGLPLETEGVLRMEIVTAQNRYKNASSTAGDLVTVDTFLQTNGAFPNSTFANGVTSYPTGANPDIFNYGLMGKTVEAGFRKNATIKNLYLDTDKQVDTADWITLETAPIFQQIKGYLDVYGGLNIGGAGTQAADVIGSVLNGQGLGLAKGGIVTNFDLRSSLAGRVLGATGLINDTKLGMIGGQQLALALANNAAFNTEQAALGTLNVQDNVLSLIRNGTLVGFRPNYQITVPSSSGGRVADYTAKILGFTLPKSYLNDAGSIFLSESDTDNINRANSMILNTGKGQVVALIANMNANLIGTTQYDNPDNTRFRSGYSPGYKDNRGEKAINPNVYAFSDADGIIYNFVSNGLSVIPEISYNRSAMIEKYGFTGFEDSGIKGDSYSDNNIRTPSFSWGSDTGGLVNSLDNYQTVIHEKKTLLGKTQHLFNNVGMKSIVSSKGQMNVLPSQIQTAIVGYGISKGNAVMSSNNFDLDTGRYIGSSAKTADDTYCRSWTTFSRYEKVKNLVRNSGLSSIVPYRNQMNGSVLDNNGFVKIAPYATDTPDDPKKYMFSIENLAWSDNVQDLLPCEVGPGDLMSGKQGRIMWFPPYDIHFSENTSASWEANNFIGRGESVYTYNNTERSGTLSFSIIVDHPSYVNSFRGSDGPDDHYIASFFAGCVEPSSKFADKLTVSELSSLASQNLTNPQLKSDNKEIEPQPFSVYFPNGVNSVPLSPTTYEDGKCNSTPIDYSINPSGENCGGGTIPGTIHGNYDDGFNFGLNAAGNNPNNPKVIKIGELPFSGWSDSGLIPALNTYLKDVCPHCSVHVKGYASSQGNQSENEQLVTDRATNMVNYLKTVLTSRKDIKFVIDKGEILSDSNCPTLVNSPTDSNFCKVLRKVDVSFKYEPQTKTENKADPVIESPNKTTRINTKITNRFYTECNYFEQLTEEDYFVFDKFREKIKYFHPAFHSTTPEGLNSRLTFLQQCTRQGPTLEGQGANNLAFGRPPVSILRIGDFYNTKIIIENIGVDYEPLVWDLNPEGVGVQPMIAKVTMSFKFIGGSTLSGPINKLQNALSFNYYANTQVYDPRADYIAKVSDLSEAVKGSNKGLTNTLSIDGKFAIVNGLVNVNTLVKTEMTQTQIGDDTPILNQTVASDNTNGPSSPQQQPSTQKSDLEKVSIANVVFSGTKNVSSKNITGTVNIKIDIESALSKDFDFKLKIFDKNNLPIDVGVGKLLTTDTIKEASFNVDSTFVTDNNVSSYQVELSFGNTKKIYSFISI